MSVKWAPQSSYSWEHNCLTAPAAAFWDTSLHPSGAKLSHAAPTQWLKVVGMLWQVPSSLFRWVTYAQTRPLDFPTLPCNSCLSKALLTNPSSLPLSPLEGSDLHCGLIALPASSGLHPTFPVSLCISGFIVASCEWRTWIDAVLNPLINYSLPALLYPWGRRLTDSRSYCSMPAYLSPVCTSSLSLSEICLGTSQWSQFCQLEVI